MCKDDFGFGTCFPYGVNEGPCAFDNQCKDNLLCGYKNCTNKELLKSPNFPSYYPPNTEKTWLISAPFGSIINLQFQYFELQVRHIVAFENINLSHFIDWKWLWFWFPFSQTEEPSICLLDSDFLAIYDGLNAQSTQIAKLGGNLESFGISSSGNSLFVKFKTDFHKQYTGFLATIYYGNPCLNFK